MVDAVVAGHLCLDVLPAIGSSAEGQSEALFQPGQLAIVGPVEHSTGGAVSNTGLALTKLGVDTWLMGKVGDDLFGHAVLDHVRGYGTGLLEAMIVDPAVRTSYTIVINRPGVDRSFLHYPGANDTFAADEIHYDLLREARLFHFGYPPLMRRMFEDGGRELTLAYRRAKETGITTSLDMALPDPSSPAGKVDWGAILRSTLPFVDIFLPSIEEILYMVRTDTYRELRDKVGGPDILSLIRPQLLSDLSQELIALGAKFVVLKLGDRGLYLRTAGHKKLTTMGRARPSDLATWANRELWAPCFKADIVGTTGAGDATIAGFLSALLRDLPPEAALTVAVAVGACNVEAIDALGGIRSWDETRQRVREGWPRHKLVLNAPGWIYDAQNQLWSGPAKG
jgi:sugar/nucleoside kinase (ribokinase family)